MRLACGSYTSIGALQANRFDPPPFPKHFVPAHTIQFRSAKSWPNNGNWIGADSG